jgi:hypothetical protein
LEHPVQAYLIYELASDIIVECEKIRKML